ncbi:hypothetical protein PVAP13_1NG185500 [Panicum virgatum]|uniref:Uncharacterized protein n=1 Tax=Panicum virgatum TaxID=38727 RepID=A0A8T0WPW3_PANVG|nr:hypothetical protein PVAP13_1NG185500 [Panicum virgatum]
MKIEYPGHNRHRNSFHFSPPKVKRATHQQSSAKEENVLKHAATHIFRSGLRRKPCSAADDGRAHVPGSLRPSPPGDTLNNVFHGLRLSNFLQMIRYQPPPDEPCSLSRYIQVTSEHFSSVYKL